MTVLETTPLLLTDFYKISHVEQYPPGTEQVYSTWIPRATHIPGTNKVVAFGIQAFVKHYLVDYFNEHFFNQSVNKVVGDYERVVRYTLGIENPKTDHIRRLWEIGYLPIEIKAVPEGTLVPLRVPMLTIENTDPEFFWLTNALETLFSCEVWQASTSATIALEYRKVFDFYCDLTGGDPTTTAFQGHDFSMRGMENVDAAASSGAGHLLSFTGTDTIPAILWAEKFYNADIETELVGTSIPATEHSVMMVDGADNELETYRRILKDVYPKGFVSIVSDTWDLWEVMTRILPELHDDIMSRDGRFVVRPDSGDPVDIICGTKVWADPSEKGRFAWDDWDRSQDSPSTKGVYELLWDEFGGTVNEKGYKVLDPHVGCIYGDAITMDRQREILRRLAAKGFCTQSLVLGIGSFTYQYQTRDTFGFALKSTWVRVNGVERNILKDPKTDTKGTKKSLTGRVVVVKDEETEAITAIDGLTFAEESAYDQWNLLEPVFVDGVLKRDEDFEAIRTRLALQKPFEVTQL